MRLRREKTNEGMSVEDIWLLTDRREWLPADTRKKAAIWYSQFRAMEGDKGSEPETDLVKE